MTKKPMTASTPPSSTEEFGTCMDLSLRPVSTSEALIPAATNTATMAKMIHAVGPPMMIAQMRTAMAMRIDPGSTGTMMPRQPTRIARPTSTEVMMSVVTVRPFPLLSPRIPRRGGRSKFYDTNLRARRVPGSSRQRPGPNAHRQ